MLGMTRNYPAPLSLTVHLLESRKLTLYIKESQVENLRDKPQVLWIDAIYINQMHNEERT